MNIRFNIKSIKQNCRFVITGVKSNCVFLNITRHYQLGLAYCFNKQYDESIDSYRAAIKVLEDRIGKVTKSKFASNFFYFDYISKENLIIQTMKFSYHLWITAVNSK